MSSQRKSYKLSDDVFISIQEYGKPSSTRPSLVFLHFWGGSSRSYQLLARELGTDLHIIAPDFRGWGESTGPTKPEAYSIPDLACDITSLIPQHVGVSSAGYILVGHSMGGKVAQYIASHSPAPSGLRGLFLIAPAPMGKLQLPEELKEQQKHACDTAQSAQFTFTNFLLSSEDAVSSATLTLLVEDAVKGSDFAKRAWPEYGSAEDYADSYKEITVPVKIVVGAEDRVETPEKVRREVFDKLTQAEKKELVVVPATAHIFPVEAPKALAEELKAFVTSV